MALFGMENLAETRKKKNESMRPFFVSLGLELERGRRQIVSIMNQGIRLALSGIVIAVLLGSISQEFWLLTSQIGWVSLIIVLSLLFITVIIPSSASIDKSIEYELGKLSLGEQSFSKEKLYLAATRRTSYDQAKALTRNIFDKYEEAFYWKLQKPLYEAAYSDLMNELKIQAKWQFGLSLFGLSPFTFLVIALISFLLFPSSVLAKWTENPIPYNLPMLILDFLRGNGFPFSVNLLEDPVLKFSAISTFLILTYFASSYSQDSKKVFANLHADKVLLDDLVTLLCAYRTLREEEYQIISGFYTPIGKWYHAILFGAPIVLIPNNAGKSLVLKVVRRIQESYNVPTKLICAIFIPIKSFIGSVTAIRMNIDGIEELSAINSDTSSDHMQCWVWIDKGDKTAGLYTFDNFETAREWAVENTKGGEI